jgi:hypothetical protein
MGLTLEDVESFLKCSYLVIDDIIQNIKVYPTLVQSKEHYTQRILFNQKDYASSLEKECANVEKELHELGVVSISILQRVKNLFTEIRCLVYDYGCLNFGILAKYLHIYPLVNMNIVSPYRPLVDSVRPLGVFAYSLDSVTPKDTEYVLKELTSLTTLVKEKIRPEPRMRCSTYFNPQHSITILNEIECYATDVPNIIVIYIRQGNYPLSVVFAIPCLLIRHSTFDPQLIQPHQHRYARAPLTSAPTSSDNVSAQVHQVQLHVSSIDSSVMSYDRKIDLMQCSETIRRRAYDRLREFAVVSASTERSYIILNNLTESQNKAKHYLDALLRIPFGVYRKEYIRSIFQLTLLKLLLFCELYHEVSPSLQEMLTHSQQSPQTLNILAVNQYMRRFETADVHCFQDTTLVSDILSTWSNYTLKQTEYFERMQTILDAAVYDTKPAKEQLKGIVAQWINGENKGYIIGLHGPPGVGKTTLIEHGLAQCLEDESRQAKPYVFISLCGMSHASTLKGHPYTYMSSTHGIIANALIETKCMNPILFFDELDKVSHTEQGQELISALMQITDPSQNTKYTDFYFGDIPLDLSQCLIVFSFNDKSLVHPVLLDRIHCIDLDPIPKAIKLVIAESYLIPACIRQTGLYTFEKYLTQEILSFIIDRYTDEAGVRALQKIILHLYRKLLLDLLQHKKNDDDDHDNVFPLAMGKLEEYLASLPFQNPLCPIKRIDDACVGIVNGLCACSTGRGDILQIECAPMFSKTLLDLKTTGSQGQVLKESVDVAKTIALRLVPESFLTEWLKPIVAWDCYKGFHIHCPAASVSKDGPSAGAAIAICLISTICNIPIRQNVAITGEIRQTGDVTEIGGLFAKILGAESQKIQLVLCPKDNKRDLDYCVSRGFLLNTDNPFVYKLCNSFMTIQCISTIYEALSLMLAFPESTITTTSYFNSLS